MIEFQNEVQRKRDIVQMAIFPLLSTFRLDVAGNVNVLHKLYNYYAPAMREIATNGTMIIFSVRMNKTPGKATYLRFQTNEIAILRLEALGKSISPNSPDSRLIRVQISKREPDRNARQHTQHHERQQHVVEERAKTRMGHVLPAQTPAPGRVDHFGLRRLAGGFFASHGVTGHCGQKLARGIADNCAIFGSVEGIFQKSNCTKRHR